MKCLPESKIPESNGIGIHDWHAEILAIRTFNRFLLDECGSLLRDGVESDIVRRTEIVPSCENGVHVKPFEIRDDVKFHMYCSEAPCMCIECGQEFQITTNEIQVVMPVWSSQWLSRKTTLHGKPQCLTHQTPNQTPNRSPKPHF